MVVIIKMFIKDIVNSFAMNPFRIINKQVNDGNRFWCNINITIYFFYSNTSTISHMILYNINNKLIFSMHYIENMSYTDIYCADICL